MAKRLPEEKRQAILDAIEAGVGSRARADIAREFEVSGDTVRRIAEEAGITDAFVRTMTKTATRAREADSAARRSEIAAGLLDDVAFFRAKFRQEWSKTVVVPGVGAQRVEADDAEVATGLQRLMTSVGIAVDKHMALEKHDSGDTGAEDAKSMLLGVAEGLKSMYVASLTEPAEPGA